MLIGGSVIFRMDWKVWFGDLGDISLSLKFKDMMYFPILKSGYDRFKSRVISIEVIMIGSSVTRWWPNRSVVLTTLIYIWMGKQSTNILLLWDSKKVPSFALTKIATKGFDHFAHRFLSTKSLSSSLMGKIIVTI